MTANDRFVGRVEAIDARARTISVTNSAGETRSLAWRDDTLVARTVTGTPARFDELFDGSGSLPFNIGDRVMAQEKPASGSAKRGILAQLWLLP